jgi:hypothetical protein
MQTRRLHRLGQGANENGRVETSDDRLWVVDVGGGHLRVIQGYESLKALIGSYGLPSTTRVFELSSVPKRLGDMPELAPTLQAAAPPPAVAPEPEPPAAPVEAAAPAAAAVAPVEPARTVAPVEPATVLVAAAPAPVPPAPTPVVPVEAAAPPGVASAPSAAVAPAPAPPTPPMVTVVSAPAETAVISPAHNGSHHDDFSLLDRPFDDGDFFEDPPRRWPRVLGAAAVFAVLVGGSYKLLHVKHGSSHGEAREHEATTAVAAEPLAVPAPAALPPPAAAAPYPAAPAAPAPAGAPSATAVPAHVAAPTPAPAAPSAAASVAAAARPASGAPSRAYAELVAEGKRLFDAGHSRRAQALFEQALAETPDGTTALVGLGYVQLDKGRVPQATELFEKAVEQDQSYPPGVFGLAETYRQAGKKSAALAEFKKYLALEPKGDEADIARRFVRELGR